MTWVHPPNCPGDCCNHDALNDRVLTDDAEWVWPTRSRLNHLRSSAAPSIAAAENPDST